MAKLYNLLDIKKYINIVALVENNKISVVNASN